MSEETPPIAISTTNSIEIPAEALGAPGSSDHLVISAEFKDDRFAGRDRFGDRRARKFEVRARFSKHPLALHEINGDIRAEHGSSFFMVSDSKEVIEIGMGAVSILLTPNVSRELAMASGALEATSPHQARFRFENLLSSCLDRLSYVRSAPIHVVLVTVRDIENEVQYIYYQSPPRVSVIDDHEEKLFEELRPVYALYREAQNSSSSYYRVLCYYKIMEGLLGALRASVQERAKRRQKEISTPKTFVPNHPNIASDLREYVGMSMKAFFDSVLTRAHRDAVAHFNLSDRGVLNVSSAVDREKFARVAFLADLCARLLIARHEEALRQLNAS